MANAGNNHFMIILQVATCGMQVVALVRDGELLVANAGDSRCVCSRRGAAVAMTTDHKPTDAAENERIRKARRRPDPTT